MYHPGGKLRAFHGDHCSNHSKARYRNESIHPFREGLRISRKVSWQAERPQGEEQTFGA
jgi:hypothetical protein